MLSGSIRVLGADEILRLDGGALAGVELDESTEPRVVAVQRLVTRPDGRVAALPYADDDEVMIGIQLAPREEGDEHIVVEKVLPHSLGARSGLADHDVIVEIDGETATWEELSDAKRRLVEEHVELLVERDDEPVVIELKTEGRPHRVRTVLPRNVRVKPHRVLDLAEVGEDGDVRVIELDGGAGKVLGRTLLRLGRDDERVLDGTAEARVLLELADSPEGEKMDRARETLRRAKTYEVKVLDHDDAHAEGRVLLRLEDSDGVSGLRGATGKALEAWRKAKEHDHGRKHVYVLRPDSAGKVELLDPDSDHDVHVLRPADDTESKIDALRRELKERERELDRLREKLEDLRQRRSDSATGEDVASSPMLGLVVPGSRRAPNPLSGPSASNVR